MGAGNWSWRAASGLPTKVLLVDAVDVSFETYIEAANREFVKSFNAAYAPAKLPEDLNALEWAQESSRLDLFDEYVSDEYPYWDNKDSYYREVSSDRYVVVKNTAQAAAKIAGGNECEERFEDDVAAIVIARGKLTQVVMREWQDSIYLGVGPCHELDNFVEIPVDADLERFVSKAWLRAAPSNVSITGLAAGSPIPIALEPLEKVFIDNDEPDVAALMGLAARVAEIAAATSEADAEQFAVDYGVSPSYFLEHAVGKLHDIIEFTAVFDVLPTEALAEYQREHKAHFDSLLNGLAFADEKPAMPDTAWTSKAIDMRPFRTVAVAVLNQEQVQKFVPAADALDLLAEVKPHLLQVMTEAQYGAHLKSHYDQMTTVVDAPFSGGGFLVKAMDAESGSGVLIFQGHAAWGHLDAALNGQQAWLSSGEGVERSSLPDWVQLTSDPAEVRDLVSSLAAPANVIDRLMDDAGKVLVTGVAVQMLDDVVRTVYVTRSATPDSPAASYEPILIDGQFNERADVEPSPEVTHG